MSSALEVIRHDITDEYPWPYDVSELLGTFSRPLPKRLVSDKFQSDLPFPTRELLVEALQSPAVTVLEDEENDCGEAIPVTDVIDAILSSVRMVRAAAALGRGPEQAHFSWASLITTLGTTISENVYFSEDVPFLMPRTTMRSKPRDSSDLEGKAVLLLSSFMQRSSCSEPKNDAEPASESSEKPFRDSFLPLDLPLDAYMTPGYGKRVDCCLPVICAAYEDEIESLVTSVVCQRYVWNISTPVVGVSLSKTVTNASIVIGWSVDQDGSPIIHLALSERQTDTGPLHGLFDLTDPVSALYFGQFILGCHPLFVSVENLSKNRNMRDLCWRLDHIHHDALFAQRILPPEADTFLETWLRPPSTANAAASIIHRFRSVLAYMSNSKPGSSRKAPSAPHDLLRVPSHRSATSVSSRISNRSGHSASEFAALKAQRGLAAMEPGTDTWLWERCTLRLFRIKLATDIKSDFSKQFNEMIDLYDQLTEFRWPKEWSGEKYVLPYCDRPSEAQRATFFKDYRQRRDSGKPPPKDLEPDVAASVTNHMTSLLRVVSAAQVTARQASFSGAGESAMRSAWDALFNAACCSPMEDVSPSYFVEKTIGLPKNQALGNASFPDVFQSRLFLLLLHQQQAGISVAGSIYGSVVSAVQQAVENKKRSESSPVPIQDRSFEPSTALADGLYCLEFPVDSNTVGKKPEKKSFGWVHSFFTFFKKPSKTKCAKGQERMFEYQEPSTKAKRTVKFNDAHVECLMCPEVTESLGGSLPFSVEDDNFLRFYFPRFYFPFIFIENKRATKSLRQALHQCQMYCIFGVEFLAALGITDFPVFGIVTVANEGEIIMAWKSSKSVEADYRSTYQGQKVALIDAGHRFNILVDQNCKKFNLAIPLQAFHFFVSIHRIFKRRELLAKEIQKKSAELARIWRDPQNELHNWMMKPKASVPRKPNSGSESAELMMTSCWPSVCYVFDVSLTF